MHEWVDVDERLPEVKSGLFRVKLKNGDQMDACFYADQYAWRSFYKDKTGYWWSADDMQLDREVTHWKERTIND